MLALPMYEVYLISMTFRKLTPVLQAEFYHYFFYIYFKFAFIFCDYGWKWPSCLSHLIITLHYGVPLFIYLTFGLVFVSITRSKEENRITRKLEASVFIGTLDSIPAVASGLKGCKISLYSKGKLTNSSYEASCVSDLLQITDNAQHTIGIATGLYFILLRVREQISHPLKTAINIYI
jgi:hypothetical protein